MLVRSGIVLTGEIAGPLAKPGQPAMQNLAEWVRICVHRRKEKPIFF
jgi:hypothetical protein